MAFSAVQKASTSSTASQSSDSASEVEAGIARLEAQKNEIVHKNARLAQGEILKIHV